MFLLSSLAVAGPPYHACDTAPDGSVVFVEPASGEVFRYRSGSVDLLGDLDVAPDQSWPHIVHVADDGTVHVGWHGKTLKLDDKGKAVTAKLPHAVLNDAPWVADRGRDGTVALSSRAGKVTRNKKVLLPGCQDGPCSEEVFGLSVTDDGGVLVIQFGKVLVFSPDGTRQDIDTSVRGEVVGITRGPAGTFLVSSFAEKGACLAKLEDEAWVGVAGACELLYEAR